MRYTNLLTYLLTICLYYIISVFLSVCVRNKCVGSSLFIVVYCPGYFIHDMIDIVVNGQSSNMWEVIPHHIAVLQCLLKS